ncbi:MAG: hypothetical protein B7Z03_07050 [Hydrogenophilales bacterium 32-62-9]|nr:MAG: hypothetical protein B7Z03_07050 [Hydrogenophilales bacterium 32-62-9]
MSLAWRHYLHEYTTLSLARALPSNQRGRDLVVGDLQDCFDLLDRWAEIVESCFVPITGAPHSLTIHFTL